MAIGTGLRQGELLGLSWSHVDVDRGSVQVERALQRVGGRLTLVEPKSNHSHRTVPIPAFALACLAGHRLRQRQERLLAGSRWVTDDRDLIFRTTIGTAMDGGSVTHGLQRLLERAGLPRQRFHDLRHACASLLLTRNIAPRVVMEILGHSQISLTLNTYSHVIPALPRAAADELDLLLRSGEPEAESA